MSPIPKKQYKYTKSGYFTQTQIVTLQDDYDPQTDSFEDSIDEVLKDNFYTEINNTEFEEIT